MARFSLIGHVLVEILSTLSDDFHSFHARDMNQYQHPKLLSFSGTALCICQPNLESYIVVFPLLKKFLHLQVYNPCFVYTPIIFKGFND